MPDRGKPFQPGNKLGRGRPRGSRNNVTRTARELLNSHAESVIRKALVMALQGEPAILRAVLDRIAPIRRETPVDIGKLRTTTIVDVAKASQQLVNRAASGQLTITEANGLADLLEKSRKVLETQELAQRISALESKP